MAANRSNSTPLAPLEKMLKLIKTCLLRKTAARTGCELRHGETAPGLRATAQARQGGVIRVVTSTTMMRIE